MMKHRYSELQVYANCPRQYDYKIVQRLESNRFHGVARPVGSAVHEALRAMYGPEEVSPANALILGLEFYDAAFTGKELSDEDQEKVAEGREQVKAMLVKYPWKKEDFDEIIGVEQEFEVEVECGGSARTLIGRIDRIVRTNDQLWVHDIKTTGLPMDSTLRVQKIRHQYGGYVLGAQKLTGKEVVGVMIELIKKPRVYHKKDGTWTISETGYLREPQPRTPQMLQEFRGFFGRTAELIEREVDEGLFPMNTDSCMRFNRMCEFYELCSQPEFAPKLIEGIYTRRPTKEEAEAEE